MISGARLLMLGGMLSMIASLLHAGCIVFGAGWFRFFGAPEPLVRAYEQGNSQLVWMTVGIAVGLAIWAAYAFSGAGLLARLPLLKTGLVTISLIYLARGVLLIPALLRAPYPRSEFDIWSSSIVLGYGLVYAIGTWLAWPSLKASGPMAA